MPNSVQSDEIRPDDDDLILAERERCIRCVESQMRFITNPIMQSVLIRIRNFISSGEEHPFPPSQPKDE
jgi:hypothetical protein